MSAFVITRAAETDLAQIWDFIAADNPAAATRVLDAFESAFRRFADHPELGHYREELADKRHRFGMIYSYLVVYLWEPRPIQIVRVIHAARDVQTLLLGPDAPTSGTA